MGGRATGLLPSWEHKPHLRTKAFRGYSGNALKATAWIAVPASVLVASVEKHPAEETSFRGILPELKVIL